MALKILLPALIAVAMLAPAAHAEPAPQNSVKTRLSAQFSINLPTFRANHWKQ